MLVEPSTFSIRPLSSDEIARAPLVWSQSLPSTYSLSPRNHVFTATISCPFHLTVQVLATGLALLELVSSYLARANKHHTGDSAQPSSSRVSGNECRTKNSILGTVKRLGRADGRRRVLGVSHCRRCGAYGEGNFCSNCGQQLVDLRHPVQTHSVDHQVSQQEIVGRGGAGGAFAAVLLLLLIVGGAWLFFGQPHGSPGSPMQCVPHQETVYVGSVQTASETFQITEGQRIVYVSYDKGLLLYTVYLTNDEGQRFEYHYVTSVDLHTTTITTGC